MALKLTPDMTLEEKEAILDRKKRIVRRWAIAVGIFALVGLWALGSAILDRVLKGTTDGGLEINYSKIDHKLAWIGSEIIDLNNSIAEQLGLSSNDGVLINDVTTGSPADIAGLERGDVILAINDTQTTNQLQIQEQMMILEPGDVVRLQVDKVDGGKKYVYVELGTKPSDDAKSSDGKVLKVAGTSPIAPALPTPWGISVAPLTPDVREQFDIPGSEQGVAIVAVVRDSLADGAGLDVGNVIQSINQTPTTNLQSLQESLEGEEDVLMDVYSPAEDKRFYVTLPDEGDTPPAVVLMNFSESTTGGGRVAIPSDTANLDGNVFYRFAQAPYFLIYDFDQREVTIIQNPYAAQVRGTGIVVSQMLLNQKTDAVIVNAIGPQSYDTLYLAKVEIYQSGPSTMRAALANYEAGRLPELKEANLGGYGFSSGAALPTGGSPWTESDDDEEEGGYEGQPETIPPKGKPGSNDLTLTAKSDPRVNRPELCVCPNCGAEVEHPSNTSCSDMACPICGSQLMTASPGGESSGSTDAFANLPPTEIPTTVRPIAGTTVANDLWQLSSKPDDIPPMGTTVANITNTTTSQVSVCVCPLDGTTVTHPIGIPCASLQCPVCGSRMISGNTLLTGGKPDDIPPMMGVASAVTVSSKPNNVPLLGQSESGPTMTTAGIPTAGMPVSGMPVSGMPVSGMPTSGMPVAGGPTSGGPDTGGPTSGGPAIDPSSQGGAGSASSARSTTCICPMCHAIVTHPIGVPCSSLQCPICGSRLVNAEPGGTTGGAPIQATAGMPVAGIPTAGMPVAGIPTAGMPIAGGPTTGGPDTGGPTSGGPAIDGPSLGGAQADMGGAQSGRSTTCTCPMCEAVVIHPIGVPCSALTCPICGSRLVNSEPGGTNGGTAMMATAGAMPTAGGPTSGGPNTGGPTSGGPAIDPSSQGGQSGSRSTLCLCPMCSTTVTHPIGVPCSSLTCPVCGSRLVNAEPGGTAMATAGGVPVAGMPTAGMPVAGMPVAGMPTAGITVSQSKVVQVSTISSSIVIPSIGSKPSSTIASLFDEARYFLMFGLGKYEAVRNPYYRDKRATGAEIIQFVVGKGGSVIICDNISMSALKAAKDLKVKVYSGLTGTVQQVLDIYADGRLKDTGSVSGIIDDDEEEHGGGGGPPSSKSKSKDKDSEVL